MNALIVYDSSYGNTEALAGAMREALGVGARDLPVGQVDSANLDELDLLIVGSPTQGGRPTAPVVKLLGTVPKSGLRGIKVAAFDTRFAEKEQNLGLRALMKVIGYAAPRIARTLQSKGGNLVAPPEGFIVEAKEGPLRRDEVERAKIWAQRLSVAD